MRILVYASDSDKEAKRVIEELRAEGHHASLRNAQFYQGEIEPADGIVVRHGRSQNVVDAYEAAGKPVRFFGFDEPHTGDTETVTQDQATEVSNEPANNSEQPEVLSEAEEKPKRRNSRAKQHEDPAE